MAIGRNENRVKMSTITEKKNAIHWNDDIIGYHKWRNKVNSRYRGLGDYTNSVNIEMLLLFATTRYCVTLRLPEPKRSCTCLRPSRVYVMHRRRAYPEQQHCRVSTRNGRERSTGKRDTRTTVCDVVCRPMARTHSTEWQSVGASLKCTLRAWTTRTVW